MNYKELFIIQKQLDSRIIKEHQLQDRDLLSEKVLALQVELGELANETRCFKYWSKKKSSPKEVILEEYVDCLHFILSIGLELGLDNIEVNTSLNKTPLVDQFTLVFRDSIAIARDKLADDNYRKLLEDFITLGQVLGYTHEEITNSYLEKNKINHQRQEEGY